MGVSTSCAGTLGRSLAFYTAAGAEILHAPRLWPEYGAGQYATFLLDPDGFRIEVASKHAR